MGLSMMRVVERQNTGLIKSGQLACFLVTQHKFKAGWQLGASGKHWLNGEHGNLVRFLYTHGIRKCNPFMAMSVASMAKNASSFGAPVVRGASFHANKRILPGRCRVYRHSNYNAGSEFVSSLDLIGEWITTEVCRVS